LVEGFRRNFGDNFSNEATSLGWLKLSLQGCAHPCTPPGEGRLSRPLEEVNRSGWRMETWHNFVSGWMLSKRFCDRALEG
jgi:hypothetical protein